MKALPAALFAALFAISSFPIYAAVPGGAEDDAKAITAQSSEEDKDKDKDKEKDKDDSKS